MLWYYLLINWWISMCLKMYFQTKIYFIEYEAATLWERTMWIKDIQKKKLHIGGCLRLLCLDNLQKCNVKRNKKKYRSFAATCNRWSVGCPLSQIISTISDAHILTWPLSMYRLGVFQLLIESWIVSISYWHKEYLVIYWEWWIFLGNKFDRPFHRDMIHFWM